MIGIDVMMLMLIVMMMMMMMMRMLIVMLYGTLSRCMEMVEQSRYKKNESSRTQSVDQLRVKFGVSSRCLDHRSSPHDLLYRTFPRVRKRSRDRHHLIEQEKIQIQKIQTHPNRWCGMQCVLPGFWDATR